MIRAVSYDMEKLDVLLGSAFGDSQPVIGTLFTFSNPGRLISTFFALS